MRLGGEVGALFARIAKVGGIAGVFHPRPTYVCLAAAGNQKKDKHKQRGGSTASPLRSLQQYGKRALKKKLFFFWGSFPQKKKELDELFFLPIWGHKEKKKVWIPYNLSMVCVATNAGVQGMRLACGGMCGGFVCG
jgi:hypothetical protein